MLSLAEVEILEAVVPREISKMWNDKVEATPQERKDWLVPAVFVVLAIVGAFAFGFSIAYNY